MNGMGNNSIHPEGIASTAALELQGCRGHKRKARSEGIDERTPLPRSSPLHSERSGLRVTSFGDHSSDFFFAFPSRLRDRGSGLWRGGDPHTSRCNAGRIEQFFAPLNHTHTHLLAGINDMAWWRMSGYLCLDGDMSIPFNDLCSPLILGNMRMQMCGRRVWGKYCVQYAEAGGFCPRIAVEPCSMQAKTPGH